ncbi:MAG: hypothetical protein OXN27_16450, partial [Candidatus Poribacteria bacterium]|nr:hypothetical protein [Candidatus Poribacteria bacterium]
DTQYPDFWQLLFMKHPQLDSNFTTTLEGRGSLYSKIRKDDPTAAGEVCNLAILEGRGSFYSKIGYLLIYSV